jgi:6-pyruvoyltetrahydropterin/6-carboxytetrahydropterin synthase
MHGHTGILEVEVDGCGKCSDDKTIPGMIIDFSVLKNIVQTKVLERMDHQLINDLIQVPTAENMVHRIVELLSDTPLEGHLVRVRLYETPSAWAEWKRRS